MSASDVAAWIALAIAVLFPVALLASRKWLIARIEKGIQHTFDVKLAKINAEIRANEEQAKSSLRDKEQEINALRNAILSGSANRQSLLDKRRFEAIERIWAAVNDLGQFKFLSGMMAILKFDAVAREAHTPKMQQFLGTFEALAPNFKTMTNVARDEQPYVPELLWAYFSGYRTILIGNAARFHILKSGIRDPQQFLSEGGVRTILKAILPHQVAFIDKQDIGAFHYLVDEIEALLLSELRKTLSGAKADEDATARAKAIVDAVKVANSEVIKASADCTTTVHEAIK